jgi:hypothetical protein
MRLEHAEIGRATAASTITSQDTAVTRPDRGLAGDASMSAAPVIKLNSTRAERT